jgi:hypothetical protein
MPEIFDRADDAWNYLVSHGGLEVNGRDALLVEQLTERLTSGTLSDPPDDAPRPELGDVLKKASVEQLVNAMFGVVRPYIGMMRDLLDYFTKARVTEGPGQWKLALTSKTDSIEIDLESFKKFIRVLETRHVPLEVPVLNPDQLWSISSDVFSDEMEFRHPIGMRPSSTDTDSGPWLLTSGATSWLPLPPVVYRMLQRNDGLRDVAAILYEVTSAVQSYQCPTMRCCMPRYPHFEATLQSPSENTFGLSTIDGSRRWFPILLHSKLPQTLSSRRSR